MNLSSHSPNGSAFFSHLMALLLFLFLGLFALLVSQLFGQFVVMALEGIAFEEVETFLKLRSGTAEQRRIILLFQAITACFTFVIFPLLYYKYVGHKLLSPYFKGKTSKTGLGGVFLLAWVMIPTIVWVMELNHALNFGSLDNYFRDMEQSMAELTSFLLQMDHFGDYLFVLLVLAFIPALGEELVFRGVIQQYFCKLTNNAHVGIWLAAILFSAIHMQFLGFFPRMLLGAALGYYFYWSGNLFLSVWGHFLNNGLQVTLFYFFNKTDIAQLANPFETAAYDWVFLGLSMLLTGFLLYFLQKKLADHQIKVQKKQKLFGN